MRRDLFSCETFYARDCPHYILYTRDILYTRARAKKADLKRKLKDDGVNAFSRAVDKSD